MHTYVIGEPSLVWKVHCGKVEALQLGGGGNLAGELDKPVTISSCNVSDPQIGAVYGDRWVQNVTQLVIP